MDPQTYHSAWEPVASGLILGLVLVWPLWRICRRAGLAPALSLLVFLPFIGGLVVVLVLALSRWPATEGEPAP